MDKFYCFAGIEIAVEIENGRIYTDDKDLTPFLTEQVTDPHRFRFEVVDALTPPIGQLVTVEGGFCVFSDDNDTVRYIGSVQKSWENAYIRVSCHEKDHRVELLSKHSSNRISAKTVLNSIAAEHLIAQSGGFVFHSSYIEWQGRGILFTAPSGTGKSTQADLWQQLRGAEIINGDRSAVRATGEGVFVCGIPFSGSSQICKNRTLPLAAIVYLKQAPTTAIRRLHGAEAFRRIWEGCSVNTWDKDDVAKVSETVLQTLQVVPVYELACTPDESAILALEGVLMA